MLLVTKISSPVAVLGQQDLQFLYLQNGNFNPIINYHFIVSFHNLGSIHVSCSSYTTIFFTSQPQLVLIQNYANFMDQ